MVGIQWPDSVSSQAGPNQGRAARVSSSAGTAPKPKIDGNLARSPTWPLSPPPSAPLQGEQQGGAVSSAAGGEKQALPDGHNDSGGGVPRPGRQAIDAVLRRPDGELTRTGKGAASEVSLSGSGAGGGEYCSRTGVRLATVVEASPPATVEHIPDGAAASKSAVTGPELLDTERSPGPSTYSDARDSQSRSPMRRRQEQSRDGGDNSSATRSNASRPSRKMRLPDFMVHMPAGSGCGTSDLPSSSTFVDVEKGSYVLGMEPAGVVRNVAGHNCRRCLEFEAKIKTMRSEHAEDIGRERNERNQLVQALEEKLRQVQMQAAEEESRLKQDLEKFRTPAEAAEAIIVRLRQELQTEAAAAESASRFKQDAEGLVTELATSQQQRDEARKKFMAMKSQAAMSEAQRQSLLKQSSTQVSHQLREELETSQKQNADLVKKMKKMVPAVQRLQEEGERLGQQLREQTELAAMNARQVKTESQEMTKSQEFAKRQKRNLQGQVAALNTELDEAKGKMKEAQGDLTKEQRLRLDENRKQQNAKAEIKRLRAELEAAETHLQQQAQAAYMAAAAAPHQQLWAVDPRIAAAVNPRAAPSQLPRSLTPHGRSVSPTPGVHAAVAGGWAAARGGSMVPAGMHAPVGSAVAARGRAVGLAASVGAVSPGFPAAAGAARVEGWPTEMEAEGTLSTMEMSAEDSPGGTSPFQNGIEDSGQERGPDDGLIESPLRGYRGVVAATTNGTGPPSMGGIPGSPIIGSSGMVPTNSASQRLFDVIEKAKERADQRRLLSGAAEEVKNKAQALEELLASDVGL